MRAEVDRYISWPGQALSYKMGEIKIRELRERAERALGDKFELDAPTQTAQCDELPGDLVTDAEREACVNMANALW